MGRRILLIGCHALPLPYSLQVVLLELVFVATFGFHVHLQPFESRECNQAETIFLAVLAMVRRTL